MYIERFTLGPVATNAYLLGCETTRRAAVIDAPEGVVKPILRSAKERSLSIEMLLMTHSHQDHIAGARELREKTGAPLYIHAADLPNLESPGSDGLPAMMAVDPCKTDHLLVDQQKILLGDLIITVLHTPGHTTGGVSFYLEKEAALFSGDTLFRGAIGNLSFPTARPAQMWASLKRLAALPPETEVFPGHGDSTTIGEEQWIIHAHEKYS